MTTATDTGQRCARCGKLRAPGAFIANSLLCAWCRRYDAEAAAARVCPDCNKLRPPRDFQSNVICRYCWTRGEDAPPAPPRAFPPRPAQCVRCGIRGSQLYPDSGEREWVCLQCGERTPKLAPLPLVEAYEPVGGRRPQRTATHAKMRL